MIEGSREHHSPPRVLYLILSHKNPEQIRRLVRVIRDGSEGPIVAHHHFPASPLGPDVLADIPDTQVVPWTEKVDWGAFSVLRRMVAALEWSAARVEFDWLVLLSGQDYPTRPLAEFEEGLRHAGCDAFLEQPARIELTGGAPAQGDFESDERLWYFYRHHTLPLLGRSALVRGAMRAARHRWRNVRRRTLPLWYVRDMPHAVWLGARRRSTPFSHSRPCLKASDWFVASRRAVDALVEAWNQDTALVDHYRGCISPSESFFHTVLCNTPGMTVHGDNLRYIVWPAYETREPSPKTLTRDDLPDILASGQPFARKFDTAVDASVLDELDRLIRGS